MDFEVRAATGRDATTVAEMYGKPCPSCGERVLGSCPSVDFQSVPPSRTERCAECNYLLWRAPDPTLKGCEPVSFTMPEGLEGWGWSSTDDASPGPLVFRGWVGSAFSIANPWPEKPWHHGPGPHARTQREAVILAGIDHYEAIAENCALRLRVLRAELEEARKADA